MLTPYGEFFPTEPGRTALVTLPDLETGERGTATVYVVSMNLDANHDGMMDRTFFGPDQTSANRPFRFWISDDNDSYNGEEYEAKGGWRRDSNDNIIGHPRDLEDFARLWISGLPSLPATNSYSVTLHWRNYTGNPTIKLYPAYEADGGVGYLQDTNTAFDQIQYVNNAGVLTGPGACMATSAPNTTVTFPADYFLTFGRKHFLFEAVGIGYGELVLTINQGTNTLAETSVFMDLIHIQNMIEQAHTINVTAGLPPSSWVSDLVVDGSVGAVPGETKQITIFVHGINNSEFAYRRSIETTFKRLYWSGYQGKVAGFRWPCAYLPDDDAVNPADYLKALNFNKGEFYAWKSANAFKLYLQYLTNRLTDYQINILAHSQGSIVASEAIKLGAPFDNCILSQAAVPAHCYDISTNVLFLQKFLDEEASRPTPLYSTNGGYHGYFTGITGNLINFFNPQDYALATGKKLGIFEANWEANHIQRKPENFAGFTSVSYVYLPASAQSWRISGGGFSGITSNIVTDPHEIMGVVARTRTAAIGAQAGVSGSINATNSVNLQTSFGFDRTREEHSAQFTRRIQNAKGYYDAILSAINLPTP